MYEVWRFHSRTVNEVTNNGSDFENLVSLRSMQVFSVGGAPLELQFGPLEIGKQRPGQTEAPISYHPHMTTDATLYLDTDSAAALS